MWLTDELARFSSGLEYRDIPVAVLDRIKLHLLDFVGSALVGAKRPHIQRLRTVFESNSPPGNGTVIGGAPLHHIAAATLNSVAGSSAPQMDDVFRESLGHPSVAVFPVALALTERSGSGPQDFLVAATVGYELATRIGAAVGHSGLANGWHPRGGLNIFAAAGCAARLNAVRDPAVIRRAFGLAGNAAAGLTGSVHFYDAWYLLSGKAVEQGMIALELAIAGLSAGERVLDDEAGGYIKTISSFPRWEALTDGLGHRFSVDRVTLKRHACSGAVAAAVEAAIDIAASTAIEPADIGRIEVFGHASMAGRLSRPHPETLAHAGMSVPFMVATAFLYRSADLGSVESALRDPRVEQLENSVSVLLDPKLEAMTPTRLPAKVVLHCRSGATHEAFVETPRGDPDNPLDEGEVIEKFRLLAAYAGVVIDTERVIDAILGLKDRAAVGQLFDWLAEARGG